MSAAILCILAYWKISQHIGFNNNSMKSNISFRMFCQIFSACWYESSTNGLGGLILRIPAGPKFLSTTRKNLTILIFLSSLFVAHYCYTETLVIFYKITTWAKIILVIFYTPSIQEWVWDCWCAVKNEVVDNPYYNNGNFDHLAEDCAVVMPQSLWNGGSIIKFQPV